MKGQIHPFGKPLQPQNNSQVCDVTEATSIIFWGPAYWVCFCNYKFKSDQLEEQQI